MFRLYQGIWRYVSVDDLKDIVTASALSSLFFVMIILFSGRFTWYPRSIFVMNFVLLVIFTGGTRFAIRIFRESFLPQSDTARNVLIIGAGTAGNEMAKMLKSVKKQGIYYRSDSSTKTKSTHGKRLQGLRCSAIFPA